MAGWTQPLYRIPPRRHQPGHFRTGLLSHSHAGGNPSYTCQPQTFNFHVIPAKAEMTCFSELRNHQLLLDGFPPSREWRWFSEAARISVNGFPPAQERRSRPVQEWQRNSFLPHVCQCAGTAVHHHWKYRHLKILPWSDGVCPGKGKAAPGTFCHDRNPADIRLKQVNFTRLLWMWILPFFMHYSGYSGESRYETDPEYWWLLIDKHETFNKINWLIRQV